MLRFKWNYIYCECVWSVDTRFEWGARAIKKYIFFVYGASSVRRKRPNVTVDDRLQQNTKKKKKQTKKKANNVHIRVDWFFDPFPYMWFFKRRGYKYLEYVKSLTKTKIKYTMDPGSVQKLWNSAINLHKWNPSSFNLSTLLEWIKFWIVGSLVTGKLIFGVQNRLRKNADRV